MRQRIRKALVIISLLLFPITLNFFSPYVPIDGAMNGMIAGSLLLFMFMFVTAIFFGRAWCSWVCPMACLSEMCQGVNNKKVNVKRLKIIRYIIFAVWAGFVIAMFVIAGGIKGVDPLRLTSHGISVDSPVKFIIYYFVLALFFIISITVGKRGACHSICWISPFLEGGFTIGKWLKIPQLRITSDKSLCVECGACNKKCPMSINVSLSSKDGSIETSDCIFCGECVDSCKKKALRYSIR